MTKKSQRESIRQNRMALSWEEYIEKSRAIILNLRTLLSTLSPKSLHTFLPVTRVREPDLLPWIHTLLRDTTIRVFIPVRKGKSLASFHLTTLADVERTSLGLLEPLRGLKLSRKISFDAILVPGLSFSRSGHRLGQGGGFYDRWLERAKGPRIGICFAQEIRDQIPLETHDQLVDGIITEAGFLRVPGRDFFPGGLGFNGPPLSFPEEGAGQPVAGHNGKRSPNSR